MCPRVHYAQVRYYIILWPDTDEDSFQALWTQCYEVTPLAPAGVNDLAQWLRTERYGSATGSGLGADAAMHLFDDRDKNEGTETTPAPGGEAAPADTPQPTQDEEAPDTQAQPAQTPPEAVKTPGEGVKTPQPVAEEGETPKAAPGEKAPDTQAQPAQTPREAVQTPPEAAQKGQDPAPAAGGDQTAAQTGKRQVPSHKQAVGLWKSQPVSRSKPMDANLWMH